MYKLLQHCNIDVEQNPTNLSVPLCWVLHLDAIFWYITLFLDTPSTSFWIFCSPQTDSRALVATGLQLAIFHVHEVINRVAGEVSNHMTASLNVHLAIQTTYASGLLR